MPLTLTDRQLRLATCLNADTGLSLQIGPFAVNLRSNETGVAQAFNQLYADYPLLATSEFVDFRIKIERPRFLRRYYRPQVDFSLDGVQPFKPLPSAEAFPFFEWGLNWCIAKHAHHYLMLHAAVLEKDGCALILPAAPGSGKSTLCAALTLSGWRLLSDEFALLARDASSVTPFPRPISLKNESIDIIQQYYPHCEIGSLVAGTAKGTIAHIKPPYSAVEKADQKPLPCWVVFPQYRSGSPTALSPLSKAEAFMRTVENSFNYNQLGRLGFNSVKGLMNRCTSYSFEYSHLEEALDTFNNLHANRGLENHTRLESLNSRAINEQ